MVIIGFMLNYMLRVNMTIAIVSMVIPTNDTLHSNDHDKSSDCFDSAIMINVTSFDNGSTTPASRSATASIPYPTRHVR